MPEQYLEGQKEEGQEENKETTQNISKFYKFYETK